MRKNTRLALPLLALLSIVLVVGCSSASGEHESHGMALQQLSGTSEIGEPQYFIASGLRTTSDCPLVNQIDTACPQVERVWLSMSTIKSASCTTGQCTVRTLTDDEVSNTKKVIDYFDKNKNDAAKPPRDAATVFEVTPLSADSVFAIDAELADGNTVTRSASVGAVQPTSLDISEWKEMYREFITDDVEPITLVPGGLLRLRCPKTHARYDGTSFYAPLRPGTSTDAWDFTPDSLEVSVEGQAITTIVDSRSCDSWLTIKANAVGDDAIVVKRRALSARWRVRVVSPANASGLSIHEFLPRAQTRSGQMRIALASLSEINLQKEQSFLRFACVLHFSAAAGSASAFAFGGCGTLEPNQESGLVRADVPSEKPEADMFASFQSVTPALAGGEVRGKVGTAEVVVPVH